MPVIARIGPYRVYYYSHDQCEPPHVHVDRDDCTAKFWLASVTLAYNIGFRAKELRHSAAGKRTCSRVLGGLE